MTSNFSIIVAAVLLGLVIIAIRVIGSSPGVKGATGERRTRKALGRGLDPDNYRILHDVTLPGRTGTTQIDHVVLSPFGIFVLETKHLFGWVFAQAGARTWTQTLGKAKRTIFQNPLRQNYAHVKALEAVTGLNSSAFIPLVVMTGQATFKTGMPRGVVEVVDLVDEIHREVRIRLTPEQLDAAQAAIETARLKPGRETDRAHRANLRRRFGESGEGVAVIQRHRRSVLDGLRLVALVLLGVVVWGGLNVFDWGKEATTPALTVSAEPSSVSPAVTRSGTHREQGTPVRDANQAAGEAPGTTARSRNETSLALAPIPVPAPQPTTPLTETASAPAFAAPLIPSDASTVATGSAAASAAAGVPVPAPESRPMIMIEPMMPGLPGGKQATVPPRPPGQQLVSTAEQRRLFEETLSCEVSGTFKDCSCFMASGAKVLVGYERCRTLARYNDVEWIVRPD
ncbi:MAG: NERD domain-containing protein [Pseudomonadota bacterium]